MNSRPTRRNRDSRSRHGDEADGPRSDRAAGNRNGRRQPGPRAAGRRACPPPRARNGTAGARPSCTSTVPREPAALAPPSPPEPPRERPRPHARAGEPGYVPRRERLRSADQGPGAEPPAYGWPQRAGEEEPDVESREFLAPGDESFLEPGPAASPRSDAAGWETAKASPRPQAGPRTKIAPRAKSLPRPPRTSIPEATTT